MGWTASLAAVRARATEAAARAHARLGLDQSEPIDIFSVIEREGIWLLFEPLRNLYGMYSRIDDAAGVVINVGHPLPLQRYTAAHEFGHHILGHRSSLDPEANILRNDSHLAPQELQAQIFAGAFLMPLPLINRTLRRMGLPRQPGTMTPGQVYDLSLAAGVSYSAAVNQLAALNVIQYENARALRRVVLSTLKAELRGGARPDDARADVWLLDRQDDGHRIRPRVGDELRVTLPERPSTGYVWMTDDPGIVDLRSGDATAEPHAFLALVDDMYERSGAEETPLLIGGGGNRLLVFRVLRPGIYGMQIAKRRPWEDRSAAADSLSIPIAAYERAREPGIAAEQLPLIMAQAA